MNVPENAQTTKMTINKVPDLVCPDFFAAGPFELTESLAAMMNQTIRENVRNNLKKAFDALKKKDATAEEFQAAVDSYIESYEPGVRKRGEGMGAAALDPIVKLARTIARAYVTSLFAKDAESKGTDFAVADITHPEDAELVGKKAVGKMALDLLASQGAEGLDPQKAEIIEKIFAKATAQHKLNTEFDV